MPGKLHISRKVPLPTAATRQDNAWQIGLVSSPSSYEL
jgi:hypothetical protein